MENGKFPGIDEIPVEFYEENIHLLKKTHKKLLTKLYFKQMQHLQLGNRQ